MNKMTKKQCEEWIKNPLINPLTKRKIKKDKITYKRIKKVCKKYNLNGKKQLKIIKKKTVKKILNKSAVKSLKKSLPKSPPKTVITKTVSNVLTDEDKEEMKKLKGFEMKTIELKEDKKQSVLLSSVAGWAEDKLPKALCIVDMDKESGKRPIRPGMANKGLDVKGITSTYNCYLISNTDLFVPYKEDIDFKELKSVNGKTPEGKLKYKEYKKIVKHLNVKYKGKRPIKLSVMLNNGGQLRLYYSLSNPKKELKNLKNNKIRKLFRKLEDYIDLEIIMKKDYSKIGGPKGQYSQSIIDWEYANKDLIYNSIQFESNKDPYGRSCKRKKRYLGDIYVRMESTKEIIKEFPIYRDSRQDFWLGRVLEELANGEELCQAGFNDVGCDFVLKL